MFHKTFFYKDAKGKRVPFKNKPSFIKQSSVDGSTTISPVDNQQPADTENISALDDVTGKVTDNSGTAKGNVEKVAGSEEKTAGKNCGDWVGLCYHS